jgi:hypothetical protein
LLQFDLRCRFDYGATRVKANRLASKSILLKKSTNPNTNNPSTSLDDQKPQMPDLIRLKQKSLFDKLTTKWSTQKHSGWYLGAAALGQTQGVRVRI